MSPHVFLAPLSQNSLDLLPLDAETVGEVIEVRAAGVAAVVRHVEVH